MINSHLYLGGVVYFCFKHGFLFLGLTGLEFAAYMRLASNLQLSSFLCFLGVNIIVLTR